MSDEAITVIAIIFAPVAVLGIVMAFRGYHVSFKAWKPTGRHTECDTDPEGDER